jgi:hypothetical protein
MFYSPTFKYLLASLQLCNFLTESENAAPLLDPGGMIRTMRASIQQVLGQLDKVMFKKTDTAMTLTIMFTICVITIGTEIRFECIMRTRERSRTIGQAYCQSVQTRWHDTLVALFSACKDLKVCGDIKESIFEITNWKLDYGKSNR